MEARKGKFIECVCFVVFLLVVVLLSGCDIEEWVEPSPGSGVRSEKKSFSRDGEMRRTSAFLDGVNEVDLEEYKKYYLPISRRVLAAEDLEHNRRHYAIMNKIGDMRCDERVSRAYGGMYFYLEHLHEFQSRDCKSSFYMPIPGCDCKKCRR